MSQSKNFAFTWNNYPTDSYLTHLEALPYRYFVIGREVAASGTPHLQGLIIFKTNQTLKKAIKLLPGCHVELCKSITASRIYCQKDGDFVEEGEFPMSAKEKGANEMQRWERARDLCKAGKVEEVDADIYMRMYRTCKEIAKDHMPAVESIDELNNEWIWGTSGVGKTRGVLARFPGAYLKTCNKWWDGYQGEPVVLIDDIDDSHKCLVHHLKIWGDHKPFLAETKGGMIKIRPERIIVTSNCPLEVMAEEPHLAALKRRYKETLMGDGGGDYAPIFQPPEKKRRIE